MLPGNAEPQLGLTPYCAKLRLGLLFSHAELGLGAPRGVLVISNALPVTWIGFYAFGSACGSTLQYSLFRRGGSLIIRHRAPHPPTSRARSASEPRGTYAGHGWRRTLFLSISFPLLETPIPRHSGSPLSNSTWRAARICSRVRLDGAEHYEIASSC